MKKKIDGTEKKCKKLAKLNSGEMENLSGGKLSYGTLKKYRFQFKDGSFGETNSIDYAAAHDKDTVLDELDRANITFGDKTVHMDINKTASPTEVSGNAYPEYEYWDYYSDYYY